LDWKRKRGSIEVRFPSFIDRLAQEITQKETTPCYSRSLYAVAKLYACWIAVKCDRMREMGWFAKTKVTGCNWDAYSNFMTKSTK
jgi:hypothetical protein